MSDARFPAARHRILQELTESEIPSMAVAVSQHGEILWEEAFGLANREKEVPATVDTMYCLASVSKPITATGLMKLVEQGEVDLDAPINRYLGSDSQLNVWIGESDDVTVRRVTNHTAGLPLHSNSYRADDRCARPPMAETIRRYGNIVTPPGERYRYSNLGYGILDHLTAGVSGMKWEDFLQSEVFLPLGMNHATAAIAPEPADAVAVRYDEGGRALVKSETDHRGASTVYCSVHDLARFGMFHLKQRQPDQKAVLSDRTIDAMQSETVRMGKVNPADLNLRPVSCYGLGWVVDDDELGYRVSHGGGMGGAATKLLMLPREGVVVAVVSNLFHPFAYTIEQDILSALLPGHADQLAAFEKEKRNAPDAEPTLGLQPISGLLGDWYGTVHTYEGDLPLTLSFKTAGDVHGRLGTQLWALVNDVKFTDGCLTGKMAGNVFTGDTTRCRPYPVHHLELDLKLRGDALNGAVIAIAGCELNHWAELKRCGSSEENG